MAFERNDIIFDYRLGYIRTETSLSGFDVIGEDGLLRILALGGYTTTVQAKQRISWADYLYKIFKDANQPVQIINGDTDGFTTAQEMMMFIRDGILLKPELVICLSGFHNFAYKLGFIREKEYVDILQKYPFTNLGQLEFYKDITSRFGLGNDKMHYGEENNMSAWEYWLSHVDIIHCLCNEFDIQHMTFLQPCVFSGKYKLSDTEKYVLAKTYGITEVEIERFDKEFRQVYKNAVQGSKDCAYITDISGLFDDDSNVYVDACHLGGEYVNKIADAVYKGIREVIKNES